MDRTDSSFTSNAITDDSPCVGYGDAIFSGSKNFTVAGGTFTNITNKYTNAPSSTEFRAIPFGDIDLLEIRMDNHSNVINHGRARRSIRRVYSAKIEGRKAGVTVAMYQGNSAEEEWRSDITKYNEIRHPNIVQIYGTASLGNMHATIFHDDLIPYNEFLGLYGDSHLATVYIHFYGSSVFREIEEYFWSSFRSALDEDECTFFIRRSTGRFCADLVPDLSEDMYHYFDSNTRETCQRGLEPLAGPNIETAVINSLALDQYYEICYWKLRQSRSISISTPTTTTLGAVYSGFLDTDRVEIAYMLDLVPAGDTSFSFMDDRQRPKEVMENGWTRFTSGDVVDGESNFQWGHALPGFAELARPWLSQANHIFNRLGISSNFEDYVLVEWMTFELSISLPTAEPPDAFLFLCPPENFLIRDTLSFEWPDCPAYWSFDPSGAERLSPEDAIKFGFPSMERSTRMRGRSWGDMVYAGLRQFHQGKGFDPDSQDLARHLGYPLYQLSTEVHIPFAHIDGEHLCEGDEESNNIREPVDAHHNASLNQDSQHSSLAEELSVSHTFRFVRNLATAFMPGAQDVESERMGFSPVLM